MTVFRNKPDRRQRVINIFIFVALRFRCSKDGFGVLNNDIDLTIDRERTLRVPNPNYKNRTLQANSIQNTLTLKLLESWMYLPMELYSYCTVLFRFFIHFVISAESIE